MIKMGRKHVLIPFIVILSLVIASFSVSFISSIKKHSEIKAYDNWYDYDWQYRQVLTIDNSAGGALTDYQIVLDSSQTSFSEVFLNSQESGADLRFVDTDGATLFNHWIESYSASGEVAKIWVKIPSISAGEIKTIYIYYGNNVASTTSSGDNTFIFFDDFNDGIIDTNKWTKGGSMTEAGGYATGNTSDVDYFFGKTRIEINTATTIRMQNKATNTSARPGVVQSYGNPYNHVGFGWQDYQDGYRYTDTYNTAVTQVKNNLYTTNWYFLESIWQAGSVIFNVDGALLRTHTTQIPDSSKVLYAQVEGAANYDYIYSRKYAVSSPTSQLSGITLTRETTPPTNPTTFKTYSSSAKTLEFTSGGWINSTAPHFEWSGAADTGGSGVDGYYLYLGTNSSADPAVTSGIIEADNSPHYTTSTNFTLSQPMVEDTTYYFRTKTKDKAQNVSSAGDMFTYSFETSTPDPPEYINVSPAGCSTSTDFTFSWSAAADNGDSNIAGYQYKKGASGEVQFTDQLSIGETSYQDSDNVFYLRSIDNAGNTSYWQTAVYCTVEAPRIIDGPYVEARPSTLVITWRSSKETTSHVEVYDGNTYLSEFGRNILATEHSINVLGLKSDKAYRYRLSWKDSEGNLNYSDWFETTTAAAPKVIDLSVRIVSPTSVLVSFLTNYPAAATINYDKGSVFVDKVEFSSLATAFSQRIDNLEVDTSYTLRIIAASEDGTEFAISKDFSTPSFPAISNISYNFSAKVTIDVEFSWMTNVETTSSLFYRLQGEQRYKEVSISEKTLNHKLTLENLAESSVYEFYLQGTDQFGNIATSGVSTFSTPLDTRPPTISDIVIETSNVGIGKEDKAQAAISYATDEPAKCFIEYAEGISGDSYSNKTPSDEAMSDSHLSIISDLKPQTPYHFRVICSDKGGNQSESSDQTIISGEVTTSILNLILKTLNSLFGWVGGLLE